MWEPPSQSQEAGNLFDARALPPMRPEKRPSVSKAWEGASGRTSLLKSERSARVFGVWSCGLLVLFWCAWPGCFLACVFPFPWAFCTKRHKNSGGLRAGRAKVLRSSWETAQKPFQRLAGPKRQKQVFSSGNVVGNKRPNTSSEDGMFLRSLSDGTSAMGILRFSGLCRPWPPTSERELMSGIPLLL